MRTATTLCICFFLTHHTTAGEAEGITSAVVYHVQLTDEEQKYTRYVWMNAALSNPDTIRVVSLAMNLACTHPSNGLIVTGTPISNEVIAFNLADFDPIDPDRLVAVWDSMAIEDPVFHVPKEIQDGDPVAILAPHLGSVVATNQTTGETLRLDEMLTSLTQSPAPILEARFVVDNLMDERYLEFRNVKPGDPLADVLARSGFFYRTSRNTFGFRASFLIRSQITGDQRVVASLFGTTNRTPAFITYDLFDENDDPDRQFIRNLDRFDAIEDGREIFIPQRNGLIEFMLANGDGEIVAAAPENLAVDHTKPNGHDKTLVPGLSCVACHTSSDGEGMYRKVPNAFSLLPLPGNTTSERNALQTTFSENMEDADGLLGRARRDFTIAASPIVGIEQGAVNRVGQAMTAMVYQYRYGMVTEEQAQKEFGVTSPLRDLLPLDPNQLLDPEVYLVINGVAISRESFNAVRTQIAALLSLSKEK